MPSELLGTPLGRLRIVGFMEGCSYLLLGVTMPLKYYFATPQPNYVVGMIHGCLFIVYIVLVLQVAYLRRWKIRTTFWALLASLIPAGTFYADKKIFSREARS
ncbi:MAG: DUF3817 domain-containing protein [Tunicatimonas sp.]|uniref:DUF3817 domain-containing protein n=1 Tax=Tunicatimonas sp. TaxID=1940096 RepID=UPI003C777692